MASMLKPVARKRSWSSRGKKTCMLSFGSGSTDGEILSAAKDDSQDSAHVLSRGVLSPNVWGKTRFLRREDSRPGLMLRCIGVRRLLLYKNGVYEKVGGARGEGGWRADMRFHKIIRILEHPRRADLSA